jgi:RNA polymerase sigma-70 factor (ECF subfamily)
VTVTAQTPTGTVVDQEAVLDQRYRPGLLAHCYRMMGSVHEAEDMVQETYLKAWRASHSFEGRSSVKSWLYRIATNACLDALDSRQRRALPTGLGQDPSDPAGDLVQRPEVPWLEPVPDRLVTGADTSPDDPAAVVAGRESVRLAFVAALQHLPPRQRAVLLLRDVLAWRAAEVADAVGVSTAAVNSLHQRARATLESVHPDADSAPAPLSPQQEALLERYVDAFERYDVAAMVGLFTADAVWEMPPYTGWYQGPEAIARLIGTNCPAERPGDMRMVPTRANGQPAFALYMRGADGVHRAFQLQVLTLDGDGVGHVGAFFDPGLFARFGLPSELSGS